MTEVSQGYRTEGEELEALRRELRSWQGTVRPLAQLLAAGTDFKAAAERLEKERDGALRELMAAEARAQRYEQALADLEAVARSLASSILARTEPGYSPEDVLAYCDEARAALGEQERTAQETR